MFEISTVPLEQLNLRDGLCSSRAGAFNSFEGRVRDHNDGRPVVALEYEAYEALCRNEGKKIFDEAAGKFDIIAAKCVHRSGRLNVGDMAVWVGVIAAHRDAGFQACRYIIDEVKARLPIWKKEYYADGDSGWVNCPACADSKHAIPKEKTDDQKNTFSLLMGKTKTFRTLRNDSMPRV